MKRNKIKYCIVAVLISVVTLNSAWALSIVALAEGGNWADKGTWKQNDLPESADTAFIRGGAMLTIDSRVNDIAVLYLGDSGAAGTLDILDGGKLVLNKSSFVGRQKSGADGYLNLKGGLLQVGDDNGSLSLMIGVDTAADSVTGCFTISGGEFVGRLLVGSAIPEDAGGDILRIVGSKAQIGNNSPVGQFSLEVRESGTVEYIFDAEGISGMEFKEIATFRPTAKILVDGAAYTGGSETFTLLKAATISPKAPQITLKNFPEGTTHKWDASKDEFTVTIP